VVAEPGVVGGRGHAPLPRWGLGLAAGGVEVQGEAAGDDLALLGRWRLTGALLAEGEVGKSSLADNTRVDRRLGASLVYELGARRRWSPYLVAGAGVTQVDIGGGVYESAQSFAEGGAGLRYAVTPRLHLGLDLRAGSRAPLAAEAEPDQASYRSVTPPDDAPEAYTRGRLSAIVYF
jgi:opacity protein-like surface antigen